MALNSMNKTVTLLIISVYRSVCSEKIKLAYFKKMLRLTGKKIKGPRAVSQSSYQRTDADI